VGNARDVELDVDKDPNSITKQYGNAVERAKLVKPKLKKQAKTMYFSGMECQTIAKALQIDEDVVQYWALGVNRKGQDKHTWFQLREKNTDTVIDLFIKKKYDQLEKTGGIALALIQDGLLTIKDEVESGLKKLSVGEIRSIAEVIASLDKIARLESGQATEIINKTGLTPQQAKQILENDPFSMGIFPGEVVKKEGDSSD
jgi:hypothetical protein